MFDFLGERLTKALSNIKNMGVINEENISSAMREIRLALLEADVNYEVVKEFTSNVAKNVINKEISKSFKPEEIFIKTIKDELILLLGEIKEELIMDKKPTVMLLAGLQGSGKTTTAAKIANYLMKKHNKKTLLVGADIYRPAAIDQLEALAKSINSEVYFERENKKVLEIIKGAFKYAEDKKLDYIIIDTAGRLQIDDELMNEITEIINNFNIHEKILVVDAMMGQDAINVIKAFNEKINLTGSVITKLDGGTKGGVALSLRHLTNIPIKFIGTSEKTDGIKPFDPVVMAERILDMGDVLEIAEKVENLIDENDAKLQASKLRKGKFDLEDFLNSLKQIKKLGPLENVLKLIPGARKAGLANISVDPKSILHIEAIILSMTKKERENPSIIKASRKQRIAKGSGRSVEEINKLLNQFEEMKKMMKNFDSKSFKFPF